MTNTANNGTVVAHRFQVNDEVLVLHPQPKYGPEHPPTLARIMRLEPYRGRPGYYVLYPDAKEQWECHGGWVQESVLRGTVAESVR